MSDFDNFTSANDDPTADFLARERAVLGDDADLFAPQETTNATTGSSLEPDTLNIGGFGEADNISTMATVSSPPNTADLSGMLSPTSSMRSGGGANVSSGGADYGSLSEFPPVENINGGYTIPEIEPEIIRHVLLDHSKMLHQATNFFTLNREWRERRQHEIAERDAESERKRNETIQKARQAIDQFYEDYNTKKDQTARQNRAAEKEFFDKRDDTTSGTVWERVLREVDVNSKTTKSTRDVSRMKQLMLSLKKDPQAPGTFIQA
ncbi:uncharacterized protein VTP21DRAFT_5924 [Calcarisporiella thermophila]|uniref:uncharacterized protein n=1 Tax=Calcarisporiella thermophila TaxID=911321 RepID=UPI003743D205